MAAADNSQTRERVRSVVLRLAKKEGQRLSGDEKLVDDLGYDSLQLMELAIALESAFELRPADTLNDIEETVEAMTVADVEGLVLGATGREHL